MKIVAQKLFESGRRCGLLYEPARLKEDASPRIRVVLSRDGIYGIQVDEDSSEDALQGRWRFSPDRFRDLARMIRRWSSDRHELGGYSTGQSGGNHSITVYAPPGREFSLSSERVADDHPARRSNKSRRFGKGWLQTAAFANDRGDAIGAAFEWLGSQLYWIRDKIGIVRGRTLTHAEERTIVECGMTIEWNVRPEPRAYLVLDADDAEYLLEVARVTTDKVKG